MSIWSDPTKIVPYQIPPIRKQMNNYGEYVKNVI
jgi:hypothetical protein